MEIIDFSLVQERILTLIDLCEEENQLIPPESSYALLNFLKSHKVDKPLITVTPDGNLRATWKDSSYQTSIEFIDENIAKLVVLDYSGIHNHISRPLEKDDIFVKRLDKT